MSDVKQFLDKDGLNALWNKTCSTFIPNRPSRKFYPFIGTASRGTSYKVTLPYNGVTTSYKIYMMNTMEIVLGSSYLSGATGKIFLSYYFTKAEDNTWSVQDIRAFAIGCNVAPTITYQISNPAIFWISLNSATYNVISIKNLTAEDSAPSYDYRKTTIEAVTSVPTTDISSVPITILSNDGNKLKYNGNEIAVVNHTHNYLPLIGGTMTGALTTNNFLKITAPASDGTPTRNAAIIRSEVVSSDANKTLVHIGSNYGYIGVNENNTAKPSSHVDAIGIYRGVIGVGGTFTYDTLKSNQSNNISLEAVGNVKALSFIENGQPLSDKYQPKGNYLTSQDHYKNSVTNTNGTAQSPTNGGSFTIPNITVNANGHVTNLGTTTVTLPSIDSGEMNVQSNWNETDTSSDAYIQNKPTKLSQFTDDLRAAKYIPSTSYSANSRNANEQYNAGVIGGSISNAPSGQGYGTLFVIPYRKGSGNTTPDFAGQIHIPCGDDNTTPNDMFFRTSKSSSWNAWNKVITDKNIGNYNAGSATKLQTPRTLWGQSFDGTANVDGAITIKNGANLTLQSPSDAQTDPGDIVFTGFGGDELCRLYKDPRDSKMLMRFGETGTSYTMLHSGNIGSYKAGSTVGALIISQPKKTDTFDGSTNVTIAVNRDTLGLDKVMDYIGKTSTSLSDGSTTNPITIDSKSITAVSGNVVIDKDSGREYIWNGSAWELFGADDVASSYKPKQAVVNDPTASGTSTTFIDTISQDENGKITVTKKNIPTIPTKLSQFTDDVVAGKYLPLNGGTVTGDVTANSITAPKIVVKGSDHSATMEMNASSLQIDKELKLTVGGTADICSGIACALKADRLQVKNLISENIILGSSNNGAQSNMSFNVQKYGSISNTAPASLTTLLTVNTTGNVGIGTTSPSEKLEVNGKVKALSFIENGQPLSDKYQPKGTYLTSQDHYKNSVTSNNGTAQSPAHGGSFTIPNISVNANGHVTNLGTTTVTLPADTNTWRPVQCNGTSIGENTLNLKSGSNVTLSRSGGTITINATMPSIDSGEMNVQSNWNETNTSSDAYIQNKPTKLSQFTDDVVAGKYLPLSGGTLSGPITTPTIVISDTNHSATLKMNASSLEIDKELKLTAGGSADICPDIACALKTDRLQVKNLISENIILGNSANGSFSNMSFNIKKYGSIASQAPATLTTLLTVNTTGNVGIGVDNPSEKLEVNGKVKALSFIENGQPLSDKYQPKGTYLTSQDHYKNSVTNTNGTAQSPVHGGTFTIPNISVNANGHVTNLGTTTINLPSIPNVGEANVQSDWNETNTSSDAYIKNKPTIPAAVTSLPWNSITGKPTFATVATTGSYNDLTNKPTIPTIPSSLPSNGIINAYTTNGIISPAISVSGAIRFDTMVCTQYLGNTNKFTGCNNAILSISRFENNQYTTQLGFSGNGIYARIFNGKTPDTLTLWKTMIMDDGAGNVTANAYYINSDERLKTFGDDIKVDFDELAKLRKSHFVFNNNPTKQEIGVSAQEVQKIYPEIVNETEEGTLSVDYSKLAVVALAAIDKLNQRVQELENKLAKYE